MANTIVNRLTLSGDIDQIIEYYKDRTFSYFDFISRPKDDSRESWIEVCDVKWDAECVEFQKEDNKFIIKFFSPWNPPKDIIFVTMSLKYPDTEIMYRWDDCSGMTDVSWEEITFKNGEVIKFIVGLNGVSTQVYPENNFI